MEQRITKRQKNAQWESIPLSVKVKDEFRWSRPSALKRPMKSYVNFDKHKISPIPKGSEDYLKECMATHPAKPTFFCKIGCYGYSVGDLIRR